MIKPPQVNGLILCDKIRVETKPASFCLDGLFLIREFTRFPAMCPKFAAYASFFDGRGEGEMKLTCTRLEGETDIYYHSIWWVFSKHVQIMHYARWIEGVRFPLAGRYVFTLTFNDLPLTVRYLDVKEARS